MQASIPGPWDHDLSQRQMLNQLIHPGAPRPEVSTAKCKGRSLGMNTISSRVYAKGMASVIHSLLEVSVKREQNNQHTGGQRVVEPLEEKQ